MKEKEAFSKEIENIEYRVDTRKLFRIMDREFKYILDVESLSDKTRKLLKDKIKVLKNRL